MQKMMLRKEADKKMRSNVLHLTQTLAPIRRQDASCFIPIPRMLAPAVEYTDWTFDLHRQRLWIYEGTGKAGCVAG